MEHYHRDCTEKLSEAKGGKRGKIRLAMASAEHAGDVEDVEDAEPADSADEAEAGPPVAKRPPPVKTVKIVKF